MSFDAVIGASFDPPTNGHAWMIRQAAKRFNLHLAIAVNPEKKYVFTEQERQQMVVDMLGAETYAHDVHLHVIGNEYLVDFARSIEVNLLIRGIRDEGDFHYERKMRLANARLAPEIDTIFLMPPQELELVSSSFVKALIGPNGWQKAIKEYVPPSVHKMLLVKYDR